MSEAALAERLARELGPLAADARWSAAAAAGQPYGDYTDAIEDAKAALGVVGALEQAALSAALRRELTARALLGCLERLELHYSALVDTSVGTGDGAQQQKLSQVQAGVARVRARLAAALAQAATPPAGAPAVGVRVRGRRRPDFSLGAGDEDA